MITQINKVNIIVFGQFFSQRDPVIQHAEKPVQNNKRLALTEFFVIKPHQPIVSNKAVLYSLNQNTRHLKSVHDQWKLRASKEYFV